MGPSIAALALPHGHVSSGAEHEPGERRTWAVIRLCAAMMEVEIVGSLLPSATATLGGMRATGDSLSAPESSDRFPSNAWDAPA
jgi:hypothetical protein